MTNYLLKKGHRNIGFVGSIYATSSIMDRYHGYCKALMEKGIQIRKEWILEDRNVETGDIIVGELPDMMPTAFACNCDLVANELDVYKRQGMDTMLATSCHINRVALGKSFRSHCSIHKKGI